MIGCLPTQALAFLAVFVYATQVIAFEWKPGFSYEILQFVAVVQNHHHEELAPCCMFHSLPLFTILCSFPSSVQVDVKHAQVL